MDGHPPDRIRTKRDALVRWSWTVADTLIVAGAPYAAVVLRYDLDSTAAIASGVHEFAATSAIVFFLIAAVSARLSGTHVRGSFEETSQVLSRCVIAALVPAAILYLTPWFSVPRSVPIIAPALALLGMFALRFVVRSYRWGRRGKARPDDQRIVIFGAGQGGKQLVRALLADETSTDRLVPVAILDDDPRKRRWKLSGIRVRGSLRELPNVIARTGATALAVAIPSIGHEDLRRVQEAADRLDLDILVLPSPAQLLDSPKGTDLCRLNLEDLLGRRSVSLDSSAIARTITGKVVLVTGAGGSIGSELCRQIHRYGPAKLILLDRDESALHAAQMSLTGRALLDDGTLALCDIRDFAAVLEVFDRERPDIVFHAAALKHLTLLEQFPLEAWKTNVIGSLNVLEAAHRIGVETFVNISTDKAAGPTCVLGYSKRVAERLTADYAARDDSIYVSVRFGNVLGSRGSVITAFTSQVERGGPLTVTHPDVERYFMLIPEACQLVLQAASMGRDGEVMVLDMGEPVKILDVAKRLIRMSGKRNIQIDFTGLRPGEKLSEALFSELDEIEPSAHPLVSHVSVPAIGAASVESTTMSTHEEARAWMLTEGTREKAEARP
jgi:FlaA1/EpsC-like NDP-sugar epimerase